MFKPSVADLCHRASQLGSSVIPEWKSSRKPIKMVSVDTVAFSENIPPPDDLWSTSQNLDSLCSKISDTIYTTAARCKKQCMTHVGGERVDMGFISASVRWNRILESKDCKQLWRSINWSGDFESPPDCHTHPDDMAFCQFYETLLCPHDDQSFHFEPTAPKYIPIMDDPITPGEVADCIKLLKADKAAGVDGVAPGLLKLLDEEWILLFTFLFNCVFIGQYPLQWTVTKVFNIYKKGDRMLPANYRGISILVALAKLYDMILGQRFTLWYCPSYEQAGDQKGLGCLEQIMCLRLLIDIAQRKTQMLDHNFYRLSQSI
jgi:hypothetical protein